MSTDTEIKEERNCAFQYAKVGGQFFTHTDIVCDKDSLTLNEAKELWNQYFEDAARFIKNGGTVEMCIWIDMETPSSYNKHLCYIGSNAESNGRDIWETKKEYFNSRFKIEQPA